MCKFKNEFFVTEFSKSCYNMYKYLIILKNMRNIYISVLCFTMMFWVINADFMYQEIDPICSISGTTHTSFPWEISDTSSWNIPKAYDGECDQTPMLSPDEKKRIYAIVIEYLNSRAYLIEATNWYTLSTEGEIYLQDIFFREVQEYIPKNRDTKRDIAILNNAVKMIGYDYFIKWSESVEYLGMTEMELKALAEEKGFPFRIWGRDGEMYAVTMDYVIGRITAIIEEWIIVDYSIE